MFVVKGQCHKIFNTSLVQKLYLGSIWTSKIDKKMLFHQDISEICESIKGKDKDKDKDKGLGILFLINFVYIAFISCKEIVLKKA